VDGGNGEASAAVQGDENKRQSVAFHPDGKQALSGSTVARFVCGTSTTAKEVKVFRKHSEPLVAVAFVDQGPATLSGSRDALITAVGARQGDDQHESESRSDAGSVRIRFARRSAVDLRPSAVIPGGGTVGTCGSTGSVNGSFTSTSPGEVADQHEDGTREKELKLRTEPTC